MDNFLACFVDSEAVPLKSAEFAGRMAYIFYRTESQYYPSDGLLRQRQKNKPMYVEGAFRA
jgi:hypothetical protein